MRTQNSTHLAFLLQQNLIVFAKCSAENDARHALKAVNPFFSLAPLAADVEHVYPVHGSELHALCRDGTAPDGNKDGTHDSWPIWKRVSAIPVLFCRARSTSVSFGRKPGAPIRRTSEKKLGK